MLANNMLRSAAVVIYFHCYIVFPFKNILRFIFFYFTMDEQLGCFTFGVLTNNTSENIFCMSPELMRNTICLLESLCFHDQDNFSGQNCFGEIDLSLCDLLFPKI